MKFAEVYWSEEDIAELYEDAEENGWGKLTSEKADEIANSSESAVRDAMISAGWEALRDVIDEYEAGLEDGNNEDCKDK